MKINTVIALAQELDHVFINAHSFIPDMLKLDPYSYTIEDVSFGSETVTVYYINNATNRLSIYSVRTRDYLAWRYKENKE
jgi:hypothetical protein